MKKEIIVVALIAVLFVLVAASIVASFTFYKEYKDKVEYLEQQTQSGKARVEGLETKFDGFKSMIDEMTSQVKTYSDSIKAIQNTVTLSEEERKSLMARIEEMKKDLLDIQKDYSTSVADLKQNMMTLKDDLGKIGNKAKEVELGKITVKQDEKKDDKQASSPLPGKAAGTNFKSGNVRKAGSY